MKWRQGFLGRVRPQRNWISMLRSAGVGGQADRVAFRVEDGGQGAVGAVGGRRFNDLAAVAGDLLEGLVHVGYVEPEQRAGLRGRRPVFHPLANEAGSYEVRGVVFDVPAEDGRVERGRPGAADRRERRRVTASF